MEEALGFGLRFTKYLVNEYPVIGAGFLALGAFGVIRLAFQTAIVLAQIFVWPGTNLKKFGAKKGAWAVVTGASDGIGKEFALQLGKAGFNVLLVARNKETLNRIAEEIAQKYSVQTAIHCIDFAKATEDDFSGFANSLKDIQVGVLVNNVGKSHNMPVDFEETPLDEMRDIISINVNGSLRVTYSVLPGMVQQRRGLILNIGSFAGSVPSPMLATYSGSKAFLETFSAALQAEVEPKGITVEYVNTYFVVSKLSKIRRASAMIPQPSPYVKTVLGKIGLSCGAGFSGRPATSTPYWSHGLLDYIINLVDMPWVFIKYSLSLHQVIRKRAMRKATKKQ